MESIYKWDRSSKLFAIRCSRITQKDRRAKVLHQLIVDDDPVVRGKAALAMKECSDEELIKASKALLNLQEPETSILAMELLGFTENTDFSDSIEQPIKNNDERVVKSAIEILHLLPIASSKSYFNYLLKNYRSAYFKPLTRCFEKISTNDAFPLIKQWFLCVEQERKPDLLRIASGFESSRARNWINKKIKEIDLTKEQKNSLLWLLNDDS